MRNCPIQDLCQHFETGDNKPHNAHVRLIIPCTHWLAMACEKMQVLAELTQWATGEKFACNIKKVRRGK